MLVTTNAYLIGFNSHTRGGNAWNWKLSQLTVPRKFKDIIGNLNPLFCYTTIIPYTILNFIMIFPGKYNHYPPPPPPIKEVILLNKWRPSQKMTIGHNTIQWEQQLILRSWEPVDISKSPCFCYEHFYY